MVRGKKLPIRGQASVKNFTVTMDQAEQRLNINRKPTLASPAPKVKDKISKFERKIKMPQRSALPGQTCLPLPGQSEQTGLDVVWLPCGKKEEKQLGSHFEDEKTLEQGRGPSGELKFKN
jgi:hypothetical protein